MFVRPSLSQMLVVAGFLSVCGIGTAHAQFNPNAGYGPVVDGKRAPVGNGPKLPAALPGTAATQDRSTPADRSQQADMAPTDALFDAITRGDMLAARDAINRGADINAHNILGLTPLDESIDLSRNEITFLLLSMRGAQPGSNGQAAANSAGGKPGGKTVATTPIKPAPTPRPTLTATASRQGAPRPIADASSNRPAIGGGGNPNPQAGFLGFGG